MAAPWSHNRKPARQSHGPRRRGGRYVVEFEVPDSDSEFIATCLGIAELMVVLAASVDTWTDDLARRGMPAPVLVQFQQLADDLDRGAVAARRSAVNFADLFEDARTIAASGIRIVGPGRRRAA